MTRRKLLYISILVAASVFALVALCTGLICEVCNRACAYLEAKLTDLDLEDPA